MRQLLSLLLCSGLAFAESSPFHWRGSVAQGRAIEVRSLNGDVFAEGYDGDEVEIVAQGTDAPARIQVIQTEKGVTVCTDCSAGENLADAAKQASRVNFTVRVPKGVGLIGRTVNGAVEAEHLNSDVEAYTVNGRIRISTTRSAQARTINGSIFASLANGREFSTVNGSIILNLPAELSTRVRAETIHGRISTAFRLRNPLRFDDHVVEGAIGTGCGGLKLKTVNGSIQLNKVT